MWFYQLPRARICKGSRGRGAKGKKQSATHSVSPYHQQKQEQPIARARDDGWDQKHWSQRWRIYHEAGDMIEEDSSNMGGRVCGVAIGRVDLFGELAVLRHKTEPDCHLTLFLFISSGIHQCRSIYARSWHWDATRRWHQRLVESKEKPLPRSSHGRIRLTLASCCIQTSKTGHAIRWLSLLLPSIASNKYA